MTSQTDGSPLASRLDDDQPELCLGQGWHAGVGVDADGSAWPWLLAPAYDGPGIKVAFPAHELTGPLPREFKDRLSQCGAPTLAGWPCRITAAHCPHHRRRTEAAS